MFADLFTADKTAPTRIAPRDALIFHRHQEGTTISIEREGRPLLWRLPRIWTPELVLGSKHPSEATMQMIAAFFARCYDLQIGGPLVSQGKVAFRFL